VKERKKKELNNGETWWKRSERTRGSKRRKERGMESKEEGKI
jgi:hypothetical protein